MSESNTIRVDKRIFVVLVIGAILGVIAFTSFLYSEVDLSDYKDGKARELTPVEMMAGGVSLIGENRNYSQDYFASFDLNPLLCRAFMLNRHTDLIWEILDSPHLASAWGDAALILAYVDYSPGATEKLMRFVDCKVDPKEWDSLNSRLDIIPELGFRNNEAANQFLLKALTEEGAKEIIRKIWYRGFANEQMSKADAEVHVRFSAALGLIFTEEEELIRVVEDLFAETLQEVIAINQNYGLQSDNFLNRREPVALPKTDQQVLDLFDWLSVALGTRDYVNESGIDKFMNDRARNSMYWYSSSRSESYRSQLAGALTQK